MSRQLLKRIRLKIRQRMSIYQLLLKRKSEAPTLTALRGLSTSGVSKDTPFEIVIFGKKIDYHTIDWHCDYNSGYCYPHWKRFDKIKINKIYNQGIDVIFPWELSRFQFGIDLALCYHQSNDMKYYNLFKQLVTDWITKNPFLIGVNWICTMDVAIRAANWIIAVNMFNDIFWKDTEFVVKLSKTLLKHAQYIIKFPTKNGEKGNNHYVAGFSGQLLLALSFKHLYQSKRWLKKALDGLTYCIENQIYEDGTHFEDSIAYHRLVLELFATSVIIGRNNKIEFSNIFYSKLFRMFEFVSAYMDHQGNFPQIGDNDSGRFIKLTHSQEQNHLYLLELGQQIFTYDFGREEGRSYLLPVFMNYTKRVSLMELGIQPRACKKTVSFADGGFYFLKNQCFHVTVFCPKSIEGGHRHFDVGSFTLSYQGIPVVVDPGTGVYTSNLAIRKRLRDYPSHNFFYLNKTNEKNDAYFGIQVDMDVQVVFFSDSSMKIRALLEGDITVERQFNLYDSSFVIQDSITGSRQELLSALHFADFELSDIEDNRFILNDLTVTISGAKSIKKEKYLYSPSYSILEEKEKIVFHPGQSITIQFCETYSYK